MFSNISFSFLLFFILQSCQTNINNGDTSLKNRLIVDSIFYDLPSVTEASLKKRYLVKEILFCQLVSNVENNEYTFSFPSKNYHLTKMEKKYILKSTYFLRIENERIPILFSTDYLFNNELSKSIKTTNDFNFSFIRVNAKGEIVDGFLYD